VKHSRFDGLPVSYEWVTALTGGRMGDCLEQATAFPYKAWALEGEASRAFGLWENATRDDPHPDRRTDGARFDALIGKITALYRPQPACPAGESQVLTADADTLSVLTAALEAVVYRLDVRVSQGEGTPLDALALAQARAALASQHGGVTP
jgi:hypothetical protein